MKEKSAAIHCNDVSFIREILMLLFAELRTLEVLRLHLPGWNAWSEWNLCNLD